MASPEFRRIVSTVRAFAREHELLRPGPLVVAVSGGADSIALLVLLAELAPRTGSILHVAHFDHRLRPRVAAADAAFVADLAARFGATLRVGRAGAKPASEDAARTARYAFLRRVASELGATAIATGHTRDDQAETVVLHLVRGAGLAGIAAMRPSREGIVRPLLAIERADTEAVCAELGLRPREDASNRSLRYARNRVRHRVIPELARINPKVSEALARLATAAASAEDSLERRADAALADLADGGAIDLTRLDGDPQLRETVLARAWQRATGRVLSASARTALSREAARDDGSASIDLPGGVAVREYGRLRLVAQPRRRASSSERVPEPDRGREPDGDALALEPERAATWHGWSFLMTKAPFDDGQYPLSARLPAGQPTGLVVRSRRPGDRMAGAMRGKVQDVLIDRKVPSRLRADHPLVVLANGSVWWIPGVTEPSAASDGGTWLIAARPAASDP